MQAVYEWCGEDLVRDGHTVQFSISPTKRYGVFKVLARLLHTVDGRPSGVALQVAGEWPNAARAELTQYLLALTMQLDAQMARDALQQGTQP